MKTTKRIGSALIMALVLLALSGAARGGDIHDAASAGDVAKVKVLLAYNPDLVNAESTKITETQMVKFVEEAGIYARKVGKERVLKEFSDKTGKFVRAGGQLYIYAYDFHCVCLAHGSTPELIGKDLTNETDSNGLLVIQKLRDTARARKGFVRYGWNDPATGQEGKKLGFVMKVDNTYWLGSGIYLK